jgi:hypothetical protein
MISNPGIFAGIFLFERYFERSAALYLSNALDPEHYVLNFTSFTFS